MRFRANRVLSGMVCVLALSALQARADEEGVKLARTFKEKDTNRFKQVTKVSAGGMDIVLTSVNKDTIKEIKKTGEVVIVHENESTTMEMNGAPMDLPSSPPSTLTIDKSGKLAEFKPGMESPYFEPRITQLIAFAHHFVLPDKAVKKDDKWETEIDNPAVKGKKMTLKDQFLGTEKRDGKDLWKIKQIVEAPVDEAGSKTTFELTSLLDPTSGQTVHQEGSVKDLPTTQVGAVSWTEESDLLKADAQKKVAEPEKKADGDAKKP